MNDKLRGFILQLLLLICIGLLIFQFDAVYSFSTRVFFTSFLSPKLEYKVDLRGASSQAPIGIQSVFSLGKRILVVDQKSISCRTIKGTLVWKREINGSNIAVVKLGENALLIDKLRGDFSLINSKNEVFLQKKDIGEINQVSVYKNDFVAFSNFKDRKIQVFDASLKRIGVIEPPSGDTLFILPFLSRIISLLLP